MDEAPVAKTPLLTNKLYDLLKILALVIFPAFGTLYLGLSEIWGLPAAEEIVKTIVVVDTFLGVIIKLGDFSYNASEARFGGEINVRSVPNGPKMFSLEVDGDPEDIEQQDEVIFKVKKTTVKPR